MPKLKLPPGPPGWPLLGHIPHFRKEPLKFFAHLGHTYGDVSLYLVGPKRFYLVNHPELIKRVLLDQSFVRTPLTQRLMGSFLGEGVFSQEGDLHRQQRRLMQPAFHRERLAHYADIMTTTTAEVLATWKTNDQRNLVNDMMRLTFAIVSRALFGADTSGEAQIVDRAFRTVIAAIDQEYELYAALPDNAPLIRFGEVTRAIKTLQRVTGQIITRRRAEGESDHGDLLSMLLSAQDTDGSRMTDAQVSGQVLSLLFAGHETTANLLCWTWWLLGRHPEIVAKLRAEARTVTNGQPLHYSHLPRLTYTRQVVDETLRLYPPAWYAERASPVETELGGYTIPAKQPLAISVYVTHRDPRFFDAPETFDPDRFSPERVEKIHKFAYLPFGAGVHQCIGNAFAQIEATLILASMAAQFQLALPPNFRAEPRPVVTLGIANGLPVTVTRL